jgi:hypothetical protein
MIIIGAAIFFYIIRKILQNLIYIPLANSLGIPKEKKKGRSSKYQKFLENVWYSTFYPILTVKPLILKKDSRNMHFI